MGPRRHWHLAFTLTCTAVLGCYVAWLVGQIVQQAPGAWRALASCVGAALLVHQGTPNSPSRRSRTWAIAIVAAAGASTPWAQRTPWLWAAWLPALAVGARLGMYGGRAVLRRPLLVLLAALAFPYEALLPPAVDTTLQLLTAQGAAALVTLSGLPVILQSHPPALLGPHELVVSVTALCAGAPTLFALGTLGILTAELAFDALGAQLLCMLMAPAFGLAGNVLRVALSTHAANWWSENALLWDLAHEVIGYACFGLCYAALFGCVRALRQFRPRATPPASSSSASGHSVASP